MPAILTREQLAKDFYQELGLSNSANNNDIKRAYRRLALEWHPDKNINNKVEAEARFKIISEAYEVLSDTAKRAYYDRYRGTAGITDNTNDLNNFDSSVKQALISLSLYLFMLEVFYYIFKTIESTYSSSVSNPELARKVYDEVLDSFQTFNITSDEIKELGAKNISSFQKNYSTMCNMMVASINPYNYMHTSLDLDFSSCNSFHKIDINLINQSGDLSLKRSILAAGESPNLAACFALGLTYVGARSFFIFKNREDFWSSDMDYRQKMDRIVLMLIAGGLVLSGVDALTNCFGIMNMLAEDTGVIAANCVRACNDGYYKNGVLMNINGKQEIFSLQQKPEIQADAYLGYKNLAAGMVNTLAVPVTILIAKFSAIYSNKRPAAEPREENGRGHHHSHQV
ncbi:MAG: DnaJ domain-containing protein [Pseudomonadota bacterium]